MSKLTCYVSFKKTSFVLYSTPIRVELHERGMTKKGLIELLKKKGFTYDYNYMIVLFAGKTFANFNLHYFTPIYKVLHLPLPTPDYLYKSWLRWEEIKEIKKQSAINNKALKALKAAKKD